MRSRLIWTTLGLLLGGMTRGEVKAVETEVGVARVDVTPSYPVRLSGYLGREKESAGVAQKLWAKALAIGSDAQGPAVLVAVDNLGVGEAVVEEVAARLKKAVNLPREQFVVASSHTHSAPCLTGVAPNIFGKPIAPNEQATIDRYTRELTDAVERVSLAALEAREPGTLAWSQGSAAFAMNRRTPGGPVDHSLPVLRVTDRQARSARSSSTTHATARPSTRRKTRSLAIGPASPRPPSRPTTPASSP